MTIGVASGSTATTGQAQSELPRKCTVFAMVATCAATIAGQGHDHQELKEAEAAPLRRIALNVGDGPAAVLDRVVGATRGAGHDAETREFGDPIQIVPRDFSPAQGHASSGSGPSSCNAADPAVA